MSSESKPVHQSKRAARPRKAVLESRTACASHSHELTGKQSEENQKKPFLKKRSGLFRFYKCMPAGITPGTRPVRVPGGGGGSNSAGAAARRGQNLTNFDPSIAFTKNSMSSRKSHKNSTSSGAQQSQNARRNSDGVGAQRSGAFSPSLATNELIKCLKYKPDRDGGVEIYEVPDSGTTGAQNQNPSKIPIQRNGGTADTNYEMGGDAQRHLSDFRSALEGTTGAQYGANQPKTHTVGIDSPRRMDPKRKTETTSAALRNSLLWPANDKTENFACANSKDSGRKASIVSDDFIEEELVDDAEEFKYGDEPEAANSEEEILSLDDDNLSHTSGSDNFELQEVTTTKTRQQTKRDDQPIKPDLTNQLSLLQAELAAMKSKVASLERNLQEDQKTATAKHKKSSKPTDSESKSRSKVISSIQSTLQKMSSDIADIQNGFLQKFDSLEEELHIKSQRWCENQIQLADKVHSLFSELEVVSNRVKSQQHQVQNLAENVEKEFESLKAEWKEGQRALEKKLEALEQENLQLASKFEIVSSSTSQIGDTIKSRESKYSKEESLHSTRLQGPEPNTVQPVPSSNNSCVQNTENNTTTVTSKPAGGDSSEPKIECVGGQIVSARKTLQNGDVETVYTNGTREIIKADKSEIRHIYRNGDVRTVSPDGTITYFYCESQTWQTTFPTGVEFFKFPNGVTERRLPNGLIEQTDPNGRVTFFQQAPAKPVAHPPPPLVSPAAVPPSKTDQLRGGHLHYSPYPPLTYTNPVPLVTPPPAAATIQQKQPSSRLKLVPGERIIVFENGEEEIHGPDYRKRIFPDGTVKTVYQDGSQETRYPNGRIRIKDGDGNLVADVTVDNSKVVQHQSSAAPVKNSSKESPSNSKS